MKRQGSLSKKQSAKRPRQAQSTVELADTKSVREQAEPYRLATAKFPIEALTSVWKVGSNRQIDTKHVESLCRIFKEQRLQREPEENHLRIACSQAEVQRMIDHLNPTRTLLPACLPFDDWMAVNGTKAELMAGQHRVEALKRYLQHLSGQSEDNLLQREHSWWVCDIYDIDRLPPQLSVQLRANRLDPTLPDSHGQVWMELVSLAKADATLFQGKNGPIQDEMLQTLGLSGRVKFPIRRLVTLWKNSTWREMITEWCQTSVGRATFNLSLWEEMARCGIDDFWFDTFDIVLETISQLAGDDLECIQLADWNLLAQLPSERTDADVQEKFYPKAPVNAPVDSSSPRRLKFLPKLDLTAYHRTYKTILEIPKLSFPDIQKLPKEGRAQGKAVSTLLNHVVQWLNPAPSSGDRLQLWQEFLPAFPPDSSEQARALQREIFDIVRDRTDELTNSDSSAFLTQLPKDATDSYLERFKLPIWRDVLIAVHKTTGPRFHGVLSQFNTQDPTSLPSHKEPTFIHAFHNAIRHIQHVARNPALNRSTALEAPITEISPAIAAWVLQQCDEALEDQRLRRTPPWPLSVRELVACQREELGRVVSSPTNAELPSHTSSSPTGPSVRSTSQRSERYDGESAIENSHEDLTEELAQQLVQDLPPGSARPVSSDEPGEAAHQKSTEENPRLESSFLDTLPDLAEMKKRHRQAHPARPANSHPPRPSQGVFKVPQGESRKESPRAPAPVLSAKSRAPAAKTKLPSWMRSPAAQAGSK
ncbi:hypothetical protein F4804DRAFT_328591 [Jackrogersella minutella]|nr:hypothetical protein F4804DRAFT_328591 [Jackrogersella minutella]